MTSPPSPGGFIELIGLQLTCISPDEVRAHFTITPQLLQPYGLLHGGVLCSVVETLGSCGAAAWYGDRGRVVGSSNHTELLRSSQEGRLDAVGTPVHRGRTQQLWTVDVVDEQDRLVARGQLRVANLPAPAV